MIVDCLALSNNIQSTYHHLKYTGTENNSRERERTENAEETLWSNKCVNLYGINIDDRGEEEDDDDDVIIASGTKATQWVQMRVMVKQDR